MASLPPLILRQFLRPCARLAIDAVNALDAAAFTARFDDVAEDLPWVAEVAFGARPFADREAMVAAFAAAARTALRERQRP